MVHVLILVTLFLVTPVDLTGIVLDHSSTREMDDEIDRVNSLTSSQFTTVIRINRDFFPVRDNLTEIRVGDNHLVCFEQPHQPNQVYQYRLRAQLAALQGYVFHWSDEENQTDISSHPNEKMIITNDQFVGEYVLTEKGRENEFVFETAEKLVAVMTCRHRPFPRFYNVGVCRVGDVIDGGFVVQTIDSSSKTMIVIDSQGNRSSRSWSSLKCDSDGTWDIDSFSHSILRLENVSQENGVYSILVSSPLCDHPHAISRLSTLSHICFTHQFGSRHFEFCPQLGRIRFLQMGQNHQPRVVSGSFTPPTQFDIRDRRMFFPPVTVPDLNCAKNLPIMSEEYRISIHGIRSFSMRGIGGSFNPMWFESSFSIRGIAVYDEHNAYGCDTSATGPSVDQDWIAVVDRGNCMFQEKGFNMQKKGAKAVVVINGAKGGMIAALAALPGKPSLDIPVILVDREGSVLKTVYSGKQLVIKSAPIEGQSLPSVSDPISVKSEWYCDSKWDENSTEFATRCEQGDEVVLNRDGEYVAHPATVTERLGAGFFRVRLHDTGKEETVSGWQIFKDSVTPCTAEIGSMITDVLRSDTCELTVRMHSSLLCTDKRLARPKQISKDIECGIKP